MARKNILTQVYLNSTLAQPAPPLILPAPISQSIAAAFNSVSTNVSFLDNICYQIKITTTNSVGTFYVQVSDDNTNWVDMGTAGTAAAANDVIVCEVDPGARLYSRIRYASDTAGTGTCTIMITAKNLGD